MQGSISIQVEVGDEFQHITNGIIIEIMSTDQFDFVVREISPTQSPDYHLSSLTLKAYFKLHISALQKNTQKLASRSFPIVGEIWVHQKTGEEWEILAVNYANDEATVRCVGTSTVPRQGTVKCVTLFADCKPRLVYTKNPFVSNSVASSTGLHGIAVLAPPTPLPSGQSNKFFGVSMTQLCKRCTCGIDSIGGGKHSDWCDKHEKEETNG